MGYTELSAGAELGVYHESLVAWGSGPCLAGVLVLGAEIVLRLGPWEIEPALRLDYETFVASNVGHEGAFRYIYTRDNDLFWKGRPNTKWKGAVGRDIPVEMNSHGFRQREVSMAKPASTFRIACLGDSRTFGLGVWGRRPIQGSFNGFSARDAGRMIFRC